ncbi:MAG: T9SS type A sorting domain-containing protein [Rhodothermales bacterium]
MLTLIALLAFGSAQAQQTIDFEGLVKGQVVGSVFADGGYGPVTVVGSNLQNSPAVNSAVIFDSNCVGGCSGGDRDLGSPNTAFGGPGLGIGGGPGAYQNDTALGNILIVHERPSEIVEIQPGLPGVTNPDDETSATTITIEFPEAVTLFKFTIIDRESNESQNIELLGEGGVMLGMYSSPATGDNGVATLYTDAGAPGTGTAGVVKLVMTHKGSGGLDNLVFLPPPPPPPGGGCSFTLGYWKTHEEAWPVDQLTLGNTVYAKSALLGILNASPKGDKTIILAHQLIAAKLNVANSADDTDIASTITAADAWLIANGPIGNGIKNWNGGEPLSSTLDDYNNGLIGPGHCGDTTSASFGAATDAPLFVASEAPTSFGLEGNYPNPFNPTTTITFAVKEAAHVRLSVYDMLGREVQVLVDRVLEAGRYDAGFDAGNLPSGTYLYRLSTPAGTFTQTMVLSK